MRLFRLLPLFLALPAATAVPAQANPTVTSPYNASTVSSPLTLTASASTCSNQAVVSMGYSLDSSSTTTSVSGTSLNHLISAAAGGHTIHVKAWGKSGAVCVTDVAVTVSATTSSEGISVSAPLSGNTVTSPFNLSASASSCSGQAVASVGYSVDAGADITTVSGTVLTSSVSIGAGGHTIHVKSWGNNGASCVANVAVTVTSTADSVPASATQISNLQVSGTWTHVHDPGTPGTSTGSTGLMATPSRSGNARQMSTTYSNYGGERYATSFSDDTSSHNFVYDAWVYIKGSASSLANIEMDLNQVIGNGWTVIMGFQCDGWSSTWDYTENKGSATSPTDKWIHTGVKCNPRNWAVNVWHHVQIAYYCDDQGHVTYKSVTFDGTSHALNITVFSGFALGWGKTVASNFQVDGATVAQATSNVLLDDLTVSRW